MFSCGLGPNEGGPHMQSVCKIYKYDKTYICTKNDKRRRKILMLLKTKMDFTKMSHIII